MTYGLILLTPPRSWRKSHNFHHANVGKIEGSNVGSFAIMTTGMWRQASWGERLAYRVTRHPLTILAAVVFKMRGFVEFTVLHVAYVAALGWIMPMLWVA